MSQAEVLVLAIVQEQDANAAMHALEKMGAFVVYLASTGGFLGRQNATLLIGLAQSRLPEVWNVLRQICRQRLEYLTMPLEGAPLPMPAPVPVTVGGATVFVLPLEWFEQL